MTNIVVFNPNKRFWGAILVQIPFFHYLRKLHPEARLTIFSCNQQSKLLLELGLADDLHIYSRKGAYINVWKALIRMKVDLCFSLRKNSDLLNLVLMLTSTREVHAFGESIFSRLILKHWVRYNKTYMALVYLNLLSSGKPIFNDNFEWFRQIPDQEIVELPRHSFYICFIPGGSAPYKRWSIYHYLKLAENLWQKYPKVRFVFIGGNAEKEYLPLLESHPQKDQFVMLLNKDIPTLVNVIRRCCLTVSNDCGPSHIAQMLEGHYIGIWKDPPPKRKDENIKRWALGGANQIIFNAEEDKSIDSITPDSVFKAALQLIDKTVD
jgi:ADP-heptose:LPS heptosyltransferase